MPLKINLIQNLQAEERVKARDPMKFIIAGAIGLGLLPLLYSAFVYYQKSESDGLLAVQKSKWNNIEAEYKKRQEQEKIQSDIKDQASKLDLSINSRPLRANVLNDIRKIIPDQVELQRLKVTRIDNDTVQVSITGIWQSDDAQRSIGQAYIRMKSDEQAGSKMDDYILVKESVKEPVLGNVDNSKNINFDMSFQLKLKNNN